MIHNETEIFNTDVKFNGPTSLIKPSIFFPVYTTTERNALTNPQNGWIIYNSTVNKHQAYAGGVWVDMY